MGKASAGMKTWPMSVDRPRWCWPPSRMPSSQDGPRWCSPPSHLASVGLGSSMCMLRTVTERSDPSPCAARASHSMLWVIDNKEVTLVIDERFRLREV